MCCFLPMTKNCTLPTCTLLLYFSSVMPKKQQFTSILRCHMSIDLMKDWLNISWNKRQCMLIIKRKEKKKKKKACARSIQTVSPIQSKG